MCKMYKEFKKHKIYISNKTLLFSIICKKWQSKDEIMCREEESIEILKILGLSENIELLI